MKQKQNIPFGIPQTEKEIDYTTAVTNADLNEWCQRYGDLKEQTVESGTTTYEYNGKPKNVGRPFKFKIRTDFVWKDKDTNADPPRQVEGMYCQARVVHVDSVGKIWWVEKDKEELVFETTLHT